MFVNRGFTIVELLVVVLIVGIIMGLLLNVYRRAKYEAWLVSEQVKLRAALDNSLIRGAFKNQAEYEKAFNHQLWQIEQARKQYRK